MYLDILKFLNQKNDNGLILIFTVTFIIFILFHIYSKYYTDVVEPLKFKKIVKSAGKAVSKAASKTASALDPTKLVNDALDNMTDGFLKILDPIKKPFVDFFDNIEKKFKKIKEFLNSIPNALESITKEVTDDLEKALDDMRKILMKPMNGIDEMISDFQKLICLFESFPDRIANAISGVDLIFQGIGEQFELITKAAGRGLDETSTLSNYSIVFFNSYLKCFMKFLLNMHRCFFFYIVDVFGKFFYLPIRIVMWMSVQYFDFDLSPTEKKIWKGMDYIDNIIFSMFGFHIIHFPESIRKDCYTCIRLRKEVINRQAKVVDHTFNVEMPDIVNSDITKVGLAKMRKGVRHFDEVTAMPRARPPNRVK